ncbi:MAG: bifunctional precorrin-2 dehydrogenase/sirohydrochlorin ferrochelatase [Saprospiraceae bacterium]|nr:bifunctional precorrin-2 dehydrogenase/sirohydrochlorin ferrochelatase [Saprospiraceae bacterium]
MDTSVNTLYPAFFKLNKIHMLIVGAGEVGLEKMQFILKSSPDAHITIIAPWQKEELLNLIERHKNDLGRIELVSRKFQSSDIIGHDLIIAATNLPEVNHQVYTSAKYHGKLVNVADTPDLCDFYMGSIVTRGSLKVAISTNGKSPTFAKRFRQVLEEILPHDTDDLLRNLKVIRDRLKGGFEYKVKELNRITSTLVN